MLELQLMNRVKVLEHGFVLLGLLLKLLLISLVHIVQEAFPLLGLGL